MTDNRTTELREKLDKLGIKHLDSDLPYNKQTRWNRGAGGWGACYVEITHGSILPADSIIDNCTLRIYDCTPEQAIAATLGSNTKPCYATDYTHDHCKYSVNRGWVEDTRLFIPTAKQGGGTLTAEQVMAIAGKHQPDYCSDTHVCFDWQAIANELNAALGALEPHSNQLEPSRWNELFGTPERAARTLEEIKCDNDICEFCPMFEACDNCLEVPLLEWLESEVLK